MIRAIFVEKSDMTRHFLLNKNFTQVQISNLSDSVIVVLTFVSVFFRIFAKRND